MIRARSDERDGDTSSNHIAHMGKEIMMSVKYNGAMATVTMSGSTLGELMVAWSTEKAEKAGWWKAQAVKLATEDARKDADSWVSFFYHELWRVFGEVYGPLEEVEEGNSHWMTVLEHFDYECERSFQMEMNRR